MRPPEACVLQVNDRLVVGAIRKEVPKNSHTLPGTVPAGEWPPNSFETASR